MIAVLALLLAGLQAQVTYSASDVLILAQGRASELEQVERSARRCGVKHPSLEIMRGVAFFRHREPGAELSVPANEITPAVRSCLMRHIRDLPKLHSQLR